MNTRKTFTPRRWTAAALVVLLAGLFWAGSGTDAAAVDEYPNIDHAKFAALTAGLSRADVEKALGKRGAHQFSAVLPQGDVTCVSYYRSDQWGEYHCLFVDDKLTSICIAPPFALNLVGNSYRRAPWDPEQRMQQLLSADNLLGPRLTAEMAARPKAKSGGYDWGLTAVALPFMAASAFQWKRRREFRRLVDLLDPFKVQLGTPQQDVETRLGTPLKTTALTDSREIRYYGSREFAQRDNSRLMLLSVVYENGRVIRVYSNEFMEPEKVL